MFVLCSFFVAQLMNSVELQAACAALGYLDGDTYRKEPDCLGVCIEGQILIFVPMLMGVCYVKLCIS
jgi:hypothetical protein